MNMRVNGLPSPNELAKTSVPSDGVGPHDHDGIGPHEHGEPSYDDDQVAFLEQKGFHVDRHHAQVLDANGAVVPSAIVAAKLHEARRQGLIKAWMGQENMMSGVYQAPSVGPVVSGPGELPPVVRHLDLSQYLK